MRAWLPRARVHDGLKSAGTPAGCLPGRENPLPSNTKVFCLVIFYYILISLKLLSQLKKIYECGLKSSDDIMDTVKFGSFEKVTKYQ